MQETPVWFLGWEDPLEKRRATSILVILQYSALENSMDCIVHGVTRIGHDWATFTFTSPNNFVRLVQLTCPILQMKNWNRGTQPPRGNPGFEPTMFVSRIWTLIHYTVFSFGQWRFISLKKLFNKTPSLQIWCLPVKEWEQICCYWPLWRGLVLITFFQTLGSEIVEWKTDIFATTYLYELRFSQYSIIKTKI